jgi:hypothetical protein
MVDGTEGDDAPAWSVAGWLDGPRRGLVRAKLVGTDSGLAERPCASCGRSWGEAIASE